MKFTRFSSCVCSSLLKLGLLLNKDAMVFIRASNTCGGAVCAKSAPVTVNAARVTVQPHRQRRIVSMDHPSKPGGIGASRKNLAVAPSLAHRTTEWHGRPPFFQIGATVTCSR